MVRTLSSTARGLGSVPGWGTKNPASCMAQPKQNKKMVNHFQDNKLENVSHPIPSKDWTQSRLRNLAIQSNVFRCVQIAQVFSYLGKNYYTVSLKPLSQNVKSPVRRVV